MSNSTAKSQSFIQLSRRQVICGGAAFSVSPLLAACRQGSTGRDSLKRLGIGLFTVRGLMEADPVGTLKALSEIGYQDVEFTATGYYGFTPAEMKLRLSDVGLTAPSRLIRLVHIKEQWDETLDAAAEAGHDYVVLAYLKNTERKNLDDYKSYIDLFSRAGEAAKARGLTFGYHNHAFEFESMDGVIPYDMLLDQISADDMTLTLDGYHFATAGVDPIPYMKRYPGRYTQLHVKDMNKAGDMVNPGTGIVDFPALISQAGPPGFKNVYFEDKRSPDDLKPAVTALNYMASLKQ